VDERPQAACCLFANDEEIESDVDAYDCQSCTVAEALDDLWPENRAAWVFFRKLVTRFTVDMGCVGIALDRLTREMEPEEFADVLNRLSVIYDELYPAQAPTES
jgi:hypothetical protein